MSDVVKLGYSEENSTRINTKTMGDKDRPEGVESKVDFTTSKKTNKTPILISY